MNNILRYIKKHRKSSQEQSILPDKLHSLKCQEHRNNFSCEETKCVSLQDQTFILCWKTDCWKCSGSVRRFIQTEVGQGVKLGTIREGLKKNPANYTLVVDKGGGAVLEGG